jgi:hypothetical protein
MKTIKFCMYCGKNPAKGNHAVCVNRLEQIAEDLRNTPDREKWKVFQAAENGKYGRVKKA